MHWLAVSPSPAITPGTTTPIRDALHWAMLDGLITLGALVASIVQIIAVLRTLRSVTVGRKQQAELRAMMTPRLPAKRPSPTRSAWPTKPRGRAALVMAGTRTAARSCKRTHRGPGGLETLSGP